MSNTKRIKIVLVEDDPPLANLIIKFLTPSGMDIHHIADGAIAIDAINSVQPHIVILDWMLPNKSGIDICKDIRSKYTGKILMLTAREGVADELSGLTEGVDDYVRKPVDPEILTARIRLLVEGNKKAKQIPQKLTFGRITIDQETQSVSIHGSRIEITNAEFNLLWMLTSRKNEVLTREDLLRELRGIEYDGTDRTIDNRIVKLRKKLGDNDRTAPGIQSVRSVGYRFLTENW